MGMTKGQGKAAIVIGVLELIIGIALVIISFVVASYGNMKTTDSPWWLGFSYLVPGIVGIVGGIYKNLCCMITFLVFNIILVIVSGIITAFVIIALTVWSAAISTYKEFPCTYNEVEKVCVCNDETFKVGKCGYLDTILAVFVITGIICVLCSTLSLAGSIVGCMATCCAPTEQPNVVVVQQHPTAGVTVQTTTAIRGYPTQWSGSQPAAGGAPFPPAYEPTGDKINLI